MSSCHCWMNYPPNSAPSRPCTSFPYKSCFAINAVFFLNPTEARLINGTAHPTRHPSADHRTVIFTGLPGVPSHTVQYNLDTCRLSAKSGGEQAGLMGLLTREEAARHMHAHTHTHEIQLSCTCPQGRHTLSRGLQLTLGRHSSLPLLFFCHNEAEGDER